MNVSSADGFCVEERGVVLFFPSLSKPSILLPALPSKARTLATILVFFAKAFRLKT